MDKRRLNFFRISKLIFDVGAKVLRQLLVETVQTSFLNDLVNIWQKQVQEIKDANHASKLWGCFIQDISPEDKTCRTMLKPLIMSWKLPTNQMMTCLEAESTLRKWKDDINQVNTDLHDVEEMLSSWLEQINDRLETMHCISESLQQWTYDLSKLCQKSRQTLLRTMENHCGDLLSSSKEIFVNWKFLSKTQLVQTIDELKGEMIHKRKKCEKELKMYFKSVANDLKRLLTSWKDKPGKSTDIPELKELIEVFEIETIAVDDTKLQQSFAAWHEELNHLFDKWLKVINERSANDRHPLLKRSPQDDLSRFQSIASQQVNDFFESVYINGTLKQQLTEKQRSTLFPSSGIPDLSVCDTTLLSIVFRNCLVHPPMQGWYKDPDESDHSLGADIIRLKGFRKSIITRIKKQRMGTSLFDLLWKDIKEVLVRLASRSGPEYANTVGTKIEGIKQYSFNKKEELKRILKFCKYDIFDELYGRVDPMKYKELMKWINCVERVKSSLQPESSNRSRDEESSSESTSDSGSSDSTSESGD